VIGIGQATFTEIKWLFLILKHFSSWQNFVTHRWLKLAGCRWVLFMSATRASVCDCVCLSVCGSVIQNGSPYFKWSQNVPCWHQMKSVGGDTLMRWRQPTNTRVVALPYLNSCQMAALALYACGVFFTQDRL